MASHRSNQVDTYIADNEKNILKTPNTLWCGDFGEFNVNPSFDSKSEEENNSSKGC